MDNETLKQRIALWKALPVDSRGPADEFVDALIARVEELESEVEDLGYELKEANEEWPHG